MIRDQNVGFLRDNIDCEELPPPLLRPLNSRQKNETSGCDLE